jgi:hypothetical protein
MVVLWTRRAAAALVLGPNVSTPRRIVPLSSFSFRFLTIPTSSASNGGAITTPLQAIQNATASLNQMSSRLKTLATTLQTSHTIRVVLNKQESQQQPQSQSQPQQQVVGVTLRDVVLHSRDCLPDQFHGSMAQTARTTLLPTAEMMEHDLMDMSHYYTQSVLPQMTLAVQICQETPCGGASWDMDLEAAAAAASATPTPQIRVQGQDTPCGALHAANLSFLETTHDTKEHVLLASRAALILRLALEFNEPLSTVRQSTDPKKKHRMRDVFASQVVATPWIRTKEEYEQFFKLKKELVLKEGKGQS